MKLKLLIVAALLLLTAGAMVTTTQSTFTRHVTYSVDLTAQDADQTQSQ